MFQKDIQYISGTLAQQQFLELIFSNNTISECCAQLNINPAALAYVRKQNIQFDQDIRAAQSVLIDMAVDRLPTLHEDIENPLTLRAVSDNIKWLASKRAKEIYGEKVDVQVTHALDLREALSLAKSRQLEFIDGNAVELKEITTDNKTVDCVETCDFDELDVFA